VVVSVSDETAALLGSEWVPVDGSHASASISETPDKSWTNKALTAYAAEHAIDLGDAKKKDDILAAIAAGPDEGSNDGDDEESDEDESDDSDSDDN
jgi:hypothetical protein